jgi:hypothetical protein
MSILNRDYFSINSLLPTLLPHTRTVYSTDYNFLVPESTTLSLATNESNKPLGVDPGNILKDILRTFIKEYLADSKDTYNGATFGCMLTTPLIVKNSIGEDTNWILNALDNFNNSSYSLRGILTNGVRAAIYTGTLANISPGILESMKDPLGIFFEEGRPTLGTSVADNKIVALDFVRRVRKNLKATSTNFSDSGTAGRAKQKYWVPPTDINLKVPVVLQDGRWIGVAVKDKCGIEVPTVDNCVDCYGGTTTRFVSCDHATVKNATCMPVWKTNNWCYVSLKSEIDKAFVLEQPHLSVVYPFLNDNVNSTPMQYGFDLTVTSAYTEYIEKRPGHDAGVRHEWNGYCPGDPATPGGQFCVPSNEDAPPVDDQVWYNTYSQCVSGVNIICEGSYPVPDLPPTPQYKEAYLVTLNCSSLSGAPAANQNFRNTEATYDIAWETGDASSLFEAAVSAYSGPRNTIYVDIHDPWLKHFVITKSLTAKYTDLAIDVEAEVRIPRRINRDMLIVPVNKYEYNPGQGQSTLDEYSPVTGVVKRTLQTFLNPIPSIYVEDYAKAVHKEDNLNLCGQADVFANRYGKGYEDTSLETKVYYDGVKPKTTETPLGKVLNTIDLIDANYDLDVAGVKKLTQLDVFSFMDRSQISEYLTRIPESVRSQVISGALNQITLTSPLNTDLDFSYLTAERLTGDTLAPQRLFNTVPELNPNYFPAGSI